MNSIIRKIAGRLARGLRGDETKPYESKVISLEPEKRCQGSILLSYILKPFSPKDSEPNISSGIYEDCFQLAKTVLDLGYSVDVINYQNTSFVPEKNYAFLIDIFTNLERLAPLVNKDCVKIFHPIWSHWLYHNAATYRRTLELQHRRGITIKELRLLKPNKAIELADFAIIMGNEVTLSTYRYAKKPIYRVPIVSELDLPWPEEKNFEGCRNNFLFFGGGGQVHKGLDLVLDAFAAMPQHHLYVCGPLNKEGDFENAYRRELYETPNIHTMGWVDLESPQFSRIANTCIGLIHPSCSEGQSGAVVTCMSTGLIPIVSYESGVDVGADFGVILEQCSVDNIKKIAQTVSGLPAENLSAMSRRAWEFVKANHSTERLGEEYRKVAGVIINDCRHDN